MGMSAYMSRELLLFIKSFWYGAVLVLFYDLFCMSRKVIRHSLFWITIEDLLYWIFCAFFLFVQFFRDNHAILRSYLGAGVALGSIACYFGISPFFVKSGIFLLKQIIKIIKLPVNIVKKPIKWLKSKIFRVKLEKKVGFLLKRNRQTSSKKVEKQGESDEKGKLCRRRNPGKWTEPFK